MRKNIKLLAKWLGVIPQSFFGQKSHMFCTSLNLIQLSTNTRTISHDVTASRKNVCFVAIKIE